MAKDRQSLVLYDTLFKASYNTAFEGNVFIPNRVNRIINAGYAYIELNLREGDNGRLIVNLGGPRPDSLNGEDFLDHMLQAISEEWLKDEKRSRRLLIIGLLIKTDPYMDHTSLPRPISLSHSLDLIRSIRSMRHGFVGTTFNAGIAFPIPSSTPLSSLQGKIWFCFNPTKLDLHAYEDALAFCSFRDGPIIDTSLNTVSFPHTDDRPFKDHLPSKKLIRVYPDPRGDAAKKFRPLRFLAAGVNFVCVDYAVEGGVWDTIFQGGWYIPRPPPVSRFIIDKVNDPADMEDNPLPTWLHSALHQRSTNTKTAANKPVFNIRGDLVLEVEWRDTHYFGTIAGSLSEEDFITNGPCAVKRIPFRRDPNYRPPESAGQWKRLGSVRESFKDVKTALGMRKSEKDKGTKEFDITVFKIRQFDFLDS